jgi:hypothetical protein
MRIDKEDAVHGPWALAATGGGSRAGAFHNLIRAAVLFALSCSSVLADPAGDVGAYKFAPGDRIVVTVFGQSKLSGAFLLDSAGHVKSDSIRSLFVLVTDCESISNSARDVEVSTPTFG